MTTPRDIGVDVKAPEGEWDGSENCPFYGSLRVRGQIIEGLVASVGMNHSIIVQNERIRSMKLTSDTRNAPVATMLIYLPVSVTLQLVIVFVSWNVVPFPKRSVSV